MVEKISPGAYGSRTVPTSNGKSYFGLFVPHTVQNTIFPLCPGHDTREGLWLVLHATVSGLCPLPEQEWLLLCQGVSMSKAGDCGRVLHVVVHLILKLGLNFRMGFWPVPAITLT